MLHMGKALKSTAEELERVDGLLTAVYRSLMDDATHGPKLNRKLGVVLKKAILATTSVHERVCVVLITEAILGG